MKKSFLKVPILAILLAGVISAPAADPPRVAGFTADKFAWEHKYESLLKALPDPAMCRRHSIALTEHPALGEL